MKNPKISIITASYNAVSTIEKTILSIINQTYPNIEYIIIDGGSTDGTVDIIKKYEDKIAYWISEPDKGIYDAWNKGLNVAHGDWIEFIGADDFLLNNISKDLYTLLQDQDIANFDLITAKGKLINKSGKFLKYCGEEFSWTTFRKYMNICHGATLHNKNLFNQIGSFDTQYRYSADYELILRKKDKLKVLFINKSVLMIQIGGASYSIAGLKESFKIKKKNNILPLYYNLYMFVKAYIGLKIKRIRWQF